jgi:hypothetical protein
VPELGQRQLVQQAGEEEPSSGVNAGLTTCRCKISS